MLLANDRRNLKLVMRQIGIVPETQTMVIPKPGVMESFKGNRIEGVAVRIPAMVFLPPVAISTARSCGHWKTRTVKASASPCESRVST